MSKINILLLSDIHFKNQYPENEGKVISAFLNDLKETMDAELKEFNYCIISGDLVNAGSSEVTFSNFYDNIVKKLLSYMPLSHIMAAPGNHDLNRTIVEYSFDDHQSEIGGDYDETQFNEDVKDNSKLFVRKFRFFDDFCKNRLMIEDFNLAGYFKTLNPHISIFFLNSAFCSCGGYNDIEDQGRLKVETSAVNKWIQENDGKKKILVMHHPIEHLVDDCKYELMSLLRSKIDIILSGHTHYEDIENVDNHDGVKYMKMTSAQLCSSKKDLNGYSVLTFNDRDLEQITFRQFSNRNNKFLPGIDFSGTDDGKKRFDRVDITVEDVVYNKLHIDFEKDMESYSHIPEWAERTLTNIPLSNVKRDDEQIYDYVRIINYAQNYQIVAPSQFGSTCFARYLSLKAWVERKELWLYLDTAEIKRLNIERTLKTAAAEYMMQVDNVKCVIFDNWSGNNPDFQQHLAHLMKNYPGIKYILMSDVDDITALKGLATDESYNGFCTLYMKELNTAAVRTIVHSINDKEEIGKENLVLKRLNEDLIDLNMHRIPINCIQLLLSLKNNLKKRPVNRVRLMDELLRVIFANRGSIYYQSVIDERNCKYLLGYLCELLLKKKLSENSYDMSFSEAFFVSQLVNFAKIEYEPSNIEVLLKILKYNQIIIETSQGMLKFRFIYWVYFFAAERMKMDDDFYAFMVNDFHVVYYPVIIEYYTGTDGNRKDIIPLLIQTLKDTAQLVHEKVGIPEGFNPYDGFKWITPEDKKVKTLGEISDKVQKSNLPDDIKDAATDKSYDMIRPYNQQINRVFENYYVNNLFLLVSSAARALRNSDFIGGDLKSQIFGEVLHGWKEIEYVLILLAPALAKNGYSGLGGKNFKLDDTFPKEFNSCLSEIIVMLPFNIIEWFRIDAVSDKLLPLLSDNMDNQEDDIKKHLIALLICAGQMDNCEPVIKKYINSVHKNSFYLYSTYRCLLYYYRYRYLDSPERHAMLELIKTGYAKHFLGVKEPGKEAIEKVDKQWNKG